MPSFIIMKLQKTFIYFKTYKLLILTIILLALAFLVPHFVGDGTNNYTGEEQEAAVRVLDDFYATQDPLAEKLRFFDFQYYIEDVYPMPSETAKNFCNLKNDDDGTGYYVVHISEVTLFGLRKDVGEIYSDCYLHKKL